MALRTYAWLPVLLLTAASPAGSVAGQGVDRPSGSLELVTKRFYTMQGRTHVDAIAQVPLDLVTVLDEGRDTRSGVYTVNIEVSDSDGLILTSSTWTREVPEQFLAVRGASTNEHFSFAVQEGTYHLEVSVADSAAGTSHSVSETFTAYDGAPVISDLLLTSEMRRSRDGESQAAPGEIQKGSLYLVATPSPVLTFENSTLYYYVEHYPGVESSLQTTASVIGADGREFVSIPEQIELSDRGGAMARGIPLAGLPAGEYEMRLTVHYPDTVVVQNATFAMHGLIAEPSRPVPGMTDLFAYYTEEQLDSLYAPLVTLIDAAERGIYEHLSMTGKRNFLRAFWQRRDETPATVENEVMTRFYVAIAAAARRFREGGAAEIPGWRTDRGRIFLKYGEPDEVLSRAQQRGFTNPYEVWKYTRGRPLKFIFYDETGFGNYGLIHSDDRNEVGYGNWETLLGEEAVEDALNF